ncbi:MAG: hypothetical protein AB7S70_13860, partial [Hyphomicrobium sp.]
MTKLAHAPTDPDYSGLTSPHEGGEGGILVGGPAPSERARPLPRISIQAFCETPQVADSVQAASEDRRLSKAHV